jgi:hypothetical protein
MRKWPAEGAHYLRKKAAGPVKVTDKPSIHRTTKADVPRAI